MLRFLGLEPAAFDVTGRVLSIGGRQLKLQRVLAQGGHATIFEARDTSSGEAFVVKQALASDEDAAEAAEREVELRSTLSQAALKNKPHLVALGRKHSIPPRHAQQTPDGRYAAGWRTSTSSRTSAGQNKPAHTQQTKTSKHKNAPPNVWTN